MKGIRLLGICMGSSPFNPEGCAPTGLKYRSDIPENLFFKVKKLAKISSPNCFVCAYGEAADCRGVSSVTGNSVVFPYTEQEEENIIFGQLYFSQQYKMLINAFKLF